ncbi:MAG: dethiobiotin synthase [Actinomycetota bacterium]|nr:dethiobiotin synthase [Actinomycetota bacterium]
MTGRVVVVTGTGTDVGKTVVTAALAASCTAAGLRVAAVKPAQTGVVPGEPGDLDVVRSLGGAVTTAEPVRLAEPLAPDTAARRAGVPLPPVAATASRVADLAATHDVVLVEGAGGLLVRLDDDGGTLADLADAVRDAGPDVTVVVVVAAGLGTLNATALTVEALRARGLEPAGLVVGSWPAEPGLAERCNLVDLPRCGVPLLGVVPAGAGAWTRDAFRAAAPGWLPCASVLPGPAGAPGR